MDVHEVTGAQLTDEQADIFNGVVHQAYDKLDLDVKSHFSPDNVFFYLEHEGDIVAFARFVKVEDVTIGDQAWPHAIYGRSLVAVLKQHRGKRFGQAIVMRMRNYAEERNWSQLGIHGKGAMVNESDTSLTEFYEHCGLHVNTSIGQRLYTPNDDGSLRSLSHVNISYANNDYFMAAVMATDEKVIIPFTW